VDLRARRLASQQEFLRIVGRGSERAAVIERDGLVGCLCPLRPDRSIVNAVAYSDAAAMVSAIDALGATYDEAGIQAWTVWVPEADGEVAAALETAGHQLDGVPREMAGALDEMDLEPRGELDLDPEPSWHDIGEINEAAYFASAGGAYFGPALVGMQGRPYVARLPSERGVCRPASCLVVFYVGEDAYVGLVATRKEAQRRGLAGELLRFALREARDRGLTSTTLEATTAGAPVYVRLGYRDLGVIQMWERRVRNETA
jgi:GNAT superfamily N-acetyltransferase